MSDFQFEIKPKISVLDNDLIFSPSKNDNIINYHKYLEIINRNEIGIYKTKLDFNVNNIETNKEVQITISPKKLYQDVYEFYYSEKNDDIKPLFNGFYNFTNKYKLILIKNGIITINNLNVGKYILPYYYTNNDYEHYGNITIIIKPKIRLGFDMFYYGKCNPDPYLNPNNGTIKYEYDLNTLEPNNYEINVIYIVNNIEDVFKYKFKIKPILYCDNNYFKIKHNIIFNYPIICYPNNGQFHSKNNYINIDNNILYFSNNLDVGKYHDIIYYNFNNQISEFSIDFIIEPDFYYSNNNKVIEYFDNTESVQPYISIYEGSFSLQEKIDGITILENGILKFNKVDIGDYLLHILYKYKDIIFSCNYNLTVKNTFKYNEIKINYSTNFEIQSDIPIVYPFNGSFLYKNTNNINVNKNTGQITVKNLYAGSYSIYILYICGKNTYSTNAIINILPTIYYNVSQLTLGNNKLYIIQKPQIFPLNGIFTAINLPFGSSINSKTGEILCQSNQSGDYNIIIYYNLNNAINNNIINLRIL